MNRKQRRAARHSSSMAAPGQSGHKGGINDLFAAAVAAHSAGSFLQAEQGYRHILGVAPEHAELHSRLGAVLMAQAKTVEAIPHLQRAIALDPASFEANGNLAQAYTWCGRREDAIDAALHALELRETPATRAMFAQCVVFARFTEDSEKFRRLLIRALSEDWIRPRELTSACISLIKQNPTVRTAIALAEAAWPERLLPAETLGVDIVGGLSRDQLFTRLLETEPVTDLGIERVLACVRAAMLSEGALEVAADESILNFLCSVARQCFINEYVFSLTETEAAAAQALRACLERALANGEPYPALWPVAVAAYFPLHQLINAQKLFARSWPPFMTDLLVQQVEEPTQERRIAATIPALTVIEGGVSQEVRQQYEENPYPRWTAAAPPPGQSAAPLNRGPTQISEALIAGCGTGLSAIELARRAPHTRILAIDLSLSSLSYAARMARKLSLTNIEFGQADIMKLGSLGRQFDFIDASGVLHHLGDPWHGWRILLSLLRSVGVMQIGLYSEFARRNIVAARALIGERGYRAAPEGIRRCREEIAAAEDPLLRSIAQGADFYTTSECRDLLFHVQEHRTTLLEIKAFLASNGLQFVGFYLDAMTLHTFAQRFPAPSARNDLDCWHVFETERPATFAGMYQFSVRKLTASAS
jgi:SAM-dependent methyltransferase/tetratricopeptide (TPR) repeat protein